MGDTETAARERVRTCKSNNPADPKVSEEGGGGGASGTGAEIPLQPVGKTMVREAVLLEPVEDPMLEQVDAPKDGCDSMGKPVLEQSVPEGLQPTERTHGGEIRGGLSPMGGTPRWSRR